MAVDANGRPRRKTSGTGEPTGSTAGALLLTPGAGADRNQRTLVAIEQAVAPLPCSRVDFPYRLRGSRAPDRPPVAIAHLRLQAEQLAAEAGIEPGRLVLGGRSYGGRMCSMAVAEGLPAAGLILLSYPLHPPGKPANLRVEHFPMLTVPVLMISGKNDPFGAPAEFAEQVAAIPGPVSTVWLGGGHAPTGGDGPITQAVLDWLAAL
ncbi:MAG: alpha/beta family hydrolase [Nakamurella sp.]